jgi:hypothetical protein
LNSAYHRDEFAPRLNLRITRAGGLFILGIAVVTHLAAALMAVSVKAHFDRKEAVRIAEAPKPGTPQPTFASNFIDCSPPEVQRAKEHLYACYRRALSSRVGR